MKPFPILLAAALFAGCSNRQPTASGRPEVTISADIPTVKRAIITMFVGEVEGELRPWFIRDESEHMITLERDAGIGAALLLGTISNPTVYGQMRVSLVPVGERTRVIAIYTLRNSHSDLGAASGAYDDIQFQLERLAARLEGRPEPVKPPPPPAPKPGTKRGR